MKKKSLFKKIFSSKQDCCSVEIKETEEQDEKFTDQNVASKSEASCCSSKMEQSKSDHNVY